MIIIFWSSLLLIIYVYIGYPVLLYLLSKIKPQRINLNDDYFPYVSFIIAAYNEEQSIEEKIKNTLQLDYPKNKLEIIIASDCSTDNTDKIVKSYASQNVILNRQLNRLGKTAAQNDTANKANGDILIFSDATTIYKKDAIKKMVRNFNDRKIGCVGGALHYINPSGTYVGEGSGLYWKYESFIKKMESSVLSLIGVSGCMYAVRKELYMSLPIDIISDFVIALIIYIQGYRTIHESEAICYEHTNETNTDEFKMRVRVALRSLRGLWAYKRLLNPIKGGLFSIQLWSHKVLRYLVPIFLFFTFISNYIILSLNWIYSLFFILQLIFYSASLIGYCFQKLNKNKNKMFFIPYYFLLVNVASFQAILKFLMGEKSIIWEPIRK